MQDMEEVYKKYAQMVYKYIFCLTRKEDITEEIVQETFTIAVKNIHKFKENCKISTWLCQIAKYVWYDTLRKDKKNEKVSIEEIENSLLFSSSMEEETCDKEDQFMILKRIQNFDEDTRSVMYLRILGNFEYAEIAEIMNKTSNWARVIYFRGKQKLKEENNDERL